MIEWLGFAQYTSIMLIVAFTALAVGLGSGKAGVAATQAINRQPSAKADIMRATIIGLALIETAAILALIITFFIIARSINMSVFSYSGIAAAMGISGTVIGYTSSFPVIATAHAIARQPFFAQPIINMMLITQSIIQTPIIFGFLISLLIMFQSNSLHTALTQFPLFAGGLCLGLGSIGPSIGLARFAQVACASTGINRKAYGRLLPFTFISEAIIETPMIFAFLISLILIMMKPTNSPNLIIIRTLAAALCIGIGTLGPSMGSSKTASSAANQIALNPAQYSALSQASMFGQGLIDAAAVYALLISLLLLFIQ